MSGKMFLLLLDNWPLMALSLIVSGALWRLGRILPDQIIKNRKKISERLKSELRRVLTAPPSERPVTRRKLMIDLYLRRIDRWLFKGAEYYYLTLCTLVLLLHFLTITTVSGEITLRRSLFIVVALIFAKFMRNSSEWSRMDEQEISSKLELLST